MIDPGRLLGTADPQRDRRILEIFVSELDKDLELLRVARDRDCFVRAAHGLKNSGAGVGAEELTAAAEAAEEINLPEWQSRRAALEQALVRAATQARDEALDILARALRSET